VEWKPLGNQFGSERSLRPNEGFIEVYDVVEVEDDVSGEDSVPKNNLDLETGSEPVLSFGDVSRESLHVFEDYLGDTFVKVGEIEIDEGMNPQSESVSNAPTGETLTKGAMRKRGSKPQQANRSAPYSQIYSPTI